jgi:hypothetical protein
MQSRPLPGFPRPIGSSIRACAELNIHRLQAVPAQIETPLSAPARSHSGSLFPNAVLNAPSLGGEDDPASILLPSLGLGDETALLLVQH